MANVLNVNVTTKVERIRKMEIQEHKLLKNAAINIDEGERLPVAFVLERHRIIEREAYFLAENDGFKRSPLDYWCEAESGVDG